MGCGRRMRRADYNNSPGWNHWHWRMPSNDVGKQPLTVTK